MEYYCLSKFWYIIQMKKAIAKSKITKLLQVYYFHLFFFFIGIIEIDMIMYQKPENT